MRSTSLKHIECGACLTLYNVPDSLNDIHEEFRQHSEHFIQDITADGKQMTESQIQTEKDMIHDTIKKTHPHNTFVLRHEKNDNIIRIIVEKEHLDGIAHYDTGNILTAKEIWITCPKCNKEGFRVLL